MKFLSKLGQGLLKGIAIVSGFSGPVGALNPKAGQALGGVADTLERFAGVITIIEGAKAVGALDKANALAAAFPSMRQIVLASPLLAGHKIDDSKQAAFDAIVNGYTSLTVDLINLFDDSGVKVEGK